MKLWALGILLVCTAGAAERFAVAESIVAAGTAPVNAYTPVMDPTLTTMGVEVLQSPTGNMMFYQNGAPVGYVDSVAVSGTPSAAKTASALSQFNAGNLPLGLWEIEFNHVNTTSAVKGYLSGGYVAVVKAYIPSGAGRAISAMGPNAPSITTSNGLGDYNSDGSAGFGPVSSSVGVGAGLSLPAPAALPASLALLGGLALLKIVRRRSA